MSGIWGSRDVPWIAPEMAEPDGFVGVGGDLRPSTLLRAYAEGVFPWFNEGDPILWWSPDPRGVIELRPEPDAEFGGLHVSRRLARTLRSGKFKVTVNRCFETVMRACGECRPEGTWVTSDMLAGYAELHRLGHAHSVETWVRADADEVPPLDPGPDPYILPDGSGRLVDGGAVWELAGGTYGVSIGGFFAAESMFYRVTDGSKVALAELVRRLRARGYVLLDVQMTTDHTSTMGAVEVRRREYLKRLRQAIAVTGVGFA